MAKRCVAISKREAWQNLSTPEGQNKMFLVSAQMRKDRKDVHGTKYIKDENGDIVVKEKEVRDRWRRYFSTLLNEENPNHIEDVEVIEGPIQEISLDEENGALKTMKNKRAPGPSGVTSDMVKLAGETGIIELHRSLQKIASGEICLEEWQHRDTIALFKGKGDSLECGKHRGLRLLEHTMKIFEKVVDARLRTLVTIMDGQFSFRGGKSCSEAIFIARTLQEMHLEMKKLRHIFVDLEKAFDRISRGAIPWALRRQGVPERLVRLVMMLYSNSRSCVQASGGRSEEFNIEVGVHQESALSPLLFITVMEEATKNCRESGPWELLYADDLVLTATTAEGVKQLFREWKADMEMRGLKVNMEKNRYMITGGVRPEPVQLGRYPCAVYGRGVGVNSILCVSCGKWCHKKCSGVRALNRVVNFRCSTCVGGVPDVRENLVIDGETLQEVREFTYLGDVLDGEGGTDRALKHQTAAGSRKWREISILLCNKHIPLKSRGAVYDACVRSVLLYGSETWSIGDM